MLFRGRRLSRPVAGLLCDAPAREQRVHTLDAGLAGPQFTPDSAERTLATFAAFDREVVGWKTRLAAMQCTSADGRLALAQRAIKFTTRRLEAEISLRAMGSAL